MVIPPRTKSNSGAGSMIGLGSTDPGKDNQTQGSIGNQFWVNIDG